MNRFEKKENDLISCIANHVIYEKNLQAIGQFRAKLNEIGVMNHIKANFSLWSGLLCVSPKVLTDVDVINLFEYATSRTGTVNRQKEKDFVYYFNRFITRVYSSMVKYNELTITLNDVLEFFTGGSSMPLGGFSKKIDCEFYNASWINDACQPLPRVQTCGLVFHSPRNFKSYEQVEKVLSMVIMECKDFGLG